ncbi:MAG: hypothetical protein ABIT08_05055 [Bacteroidia bacterium]
MKTLFLSAHTYMLVIFIAASALSSCTKSQDAKLPDMTFKSGGNYTSSNKSVTTSEIISVGITADKNKADLKTYKIYSATGNGSFSLKKTFNLTADETDHYENDYQFHPESKNNFETWKFEITDVDGNSNSVSIKLTVN